jgi:hypothetical protein
VPSTEAFFLKLFFFGDRRPKELVTAALLTAVAGIVSSCFLSTA